jgi:PKD repeat protein
VARCGGGHSESLGCYVYLDYDGRLVNVESRPSTRQRAPEPPAPDASQVFNNQSRPGASKTIYLTFKNADVSGSRLTPTTLLGFSLDKKPTTGPGGEHDLSEAEVRDIFAIWQAVADDFAPFDVNVTLQEPPPHKLVRANADDQEYGTTVHIYSAEAWAAEAVKVFVKSFGETDERVKPILINTTRLGNDKFNISGAITYALGHAMGLRRNASRLPNSDAYALDSTDVWAPVMGDYSGDKFKQFSKSADLPETPTLNESEDEIGVLLRNGLSFRPDDVGNNRFQATMLEGGSADIDGTIERHLDGDVFAINAGVGEIYVAAYLPGTDILLNSNLDITLHNISGAAPITRQWRGTFDTPAAEASPNITMPGPYFITVKPEGNGEAISGNSTYGSRGNYKLMVRWVPSGLEAPTARLTASSALIQKNGSVTFNASGSTDDQPVTGLQYRWDFGNGTRQDFNTASTAEVRYTRAGTYTATVTVKDSDNQISTARTRVTVTNAAPVLSVVPDVRFSRDSQGRLQADATIRVTDNLGNPVAGVRIEASSAAVRGRSWPSHVTDAAGMVNIPVMGGNSGRVQIYINGVSKAGFTVQDFAERTDFWNPQS